MINDTKMMHIHGCFAWKPIFAGALVAIGLSFLLNLFGVAIGLTAFTVNSEGLETLAFGGLIGTAIGIIAAMFAAGWVAGFLGNRHHNYEEKYHCLGALYGFLAWCVALIAAMYLAAHAQEYVTFYGHLISGTGDTAVRVANTPAATTATVTMTDQQATKLVISTYILFALFFLGAFSASLGGYCGMCHACKHDAHC